MYRGYPGGNSVCASQTGCDRNDPVYPVSKLWRIRSKESQQPTLRVTNHTDLFCACLLQHSVDKPSDFVKGRLNVSNPVDAIDTLLAVIQRVQTKAIFFKHRCHGGISTTGICKGSMHQHHRRIIGICAINVDKAWKAQRIVCRGRARQQKAKQTHTQYKIQ